MAVLGICIYLANAKKMVRQSAIVIVFVITLVAFPMMFFTSGGAYSGMVFWFGLGMILDVYKRQQLTQLPRSMTERPS